MKKDLDRLKGYSLHNAWWLNSYLERIRPQVLTATIHILRERLDPEKSDRYWRIVLDPFIDHYTSILINRYFRYEHLAAQTQDFVSVGLSPLSYHTFRWPHQFIEAANSSDQINHQLLSQIARAHGRCEEEAKGDQEIPKRKDGREHTGVGRATGFPTIKSWIRRYVARTLPTDVVLCNTGIAIPDLIGLAIRSGGRIVPVNIDRPQLEDIRVDHTTRQKFRAYQTSDELTQLIVNTLGTNLPVCLLEGYSAINEVIDSQLGGRVQPEVIVLGWTKGVPLRIWIASQVERGTVLLGLQPGGLYGEGHYTAEDRLRRLTDRFVTWGWKREEGDLPLPAIHLPHRTQRSRENGSVLWITREPARWTGPDAYEYGAPSSPRIGPRHFRERQNRFYAALDDRVKRGVMCRPKPVGMTPLIRQALQERIPRAAIDDYAVSYRERAREARLLVVDHFGATTFLEAVAMNVPVVMYSDLRGGEDQAFTMTELSTPYYRELHEAGIYHHGPESVAELINEIYSDVQQWWNAPTRQAAIGRFRNRFAHTTPDCREQWVSTLCRIAAGPAAHKHAMIR